MEYDLNSPSQKSIQTHAKAISKHPSFQLLGGVDTNHESQELFKLKYQVPAYSDVKEAFKWNSPDVVVVACPTVQHRDVIFQVLAHSKPKVILCEKPLSYSLNDAREILNACKKAGVKLYVNYIRRADPGALEVKSRLDSGRINSPIKGIVWYSKGFLHNGSHFFNLLEFWLGPFITGSIINSGSLYSEWDSEPDIHVKFKRGEVIFIAAFEESFSHYTIELISPEGRLRYDKGGELITWQSKKLDINNPEFKSLSDVSEVIFNDLERYQWNVLNELSSALNGKSSNLSTGESAIETLEAMNQIIK